MFGNKSLPARIYSYGGKPPTENLKEVERLMYQAHRYQNARIHLERKRREKVNRALRVFSPELADLEMKAEALDEQLDQVRTDINSARAIARKKISPEDMVRKCEEIKAELKKINPRRKELRIPIWGSPGWHKEQKKAAAESRPPDSSLTPPHPDWTKVQAKIDKWDNQKGKQFRAVSGLNHVFGTYNMVEGAVKRTGRPPKFKKWLGHGHLVIQLQKCRGKYLSTSGVFSGTDTRLRIDPLPPEAFRIDPDDGKIRPVRKLCRTKVHFRIGVEGKRKPLFAVLPVILHRPLPEEATIRFAHIIRRRIGTNCEWKFQVTLSRKGGWEKLDAAPDGSVGLDVGWRIVKSGSPLRVIYWAGDDGRHGEEVLPADWLQEMRRTEGIQSIRDKLFDAVRERLSVDLSKLQLPDWLRDQTQNLWHWKSQARLAVVIVKWRTARFSGDEKVFAYAEEWRKRYCHLYNFEANLRNQLQNRREDIYRNFAAWLRRNYRYYVIEDMDLRDFHVLPKPEEKPEDPATRQHTRDACLSLLKRCIKESMAEKPIEAPPENTTKKHHSCGSIEEWDHKELMHTCSKCGEHYDQDYNAALNLLDFARGSMVTS